MVTMRRDGKYEKNFQKKDASRSSSSFTNNCDQSFLRKIILPKYSSSVVSNYSLLQEILNF